jgi:hypothetical protein
LSVTNLVSSASLSTGVATIGTLVISDGITLSSSTIPNLVSITISSGTLLVTTLVSSANSSIGASTIGTLVVTTRIDAPESTITNLSVTTSSIGALIVSGSTINNLNTTNISSGTLIVNAVNLLPNVGDIVKQVTFSAANNQAAMTTISGLIFDETITRAFTCYLSISIVATTSLFGYVELRGLQKASGTWVLSATFIGDETNMDFDIISSGGFGRIRYTSGDEAGFVSNTLSFRASTMTL